LGASVLLIAFASIYLLIKTLLPLNQGYHITQQIAVATGLAVVSLGFIVMALSYTSWKITFWSLMVALVLLSIASLAMAMYLHRSMPEQAPHRGTAMTWWESVVCTWRNRPLVDRLSWLFLGFAATFSLGLLPILASNQQESFSEFYIDLSKSPDGSSWREALAPGEHADLIIGVTNHEHADVQYRIERAGPSGTEQIAAIHLAHDQTWEQPYTFTPTQPGADQKVEFLLYKQGDAEPYRSLHLWINVVETMGP